MLRESNGCTYTKEFMIIKIILREVLNALNVPFQKSQEYLTGQQEKLNSEEQGGISKQASVMNQIKKNKITKQLQCVTKVN
jgi:hypothetical protein